MADTRDGVWIAAGDTFVHQTKDQWSVFPAGAPVNALAMDELTLWVATDDGVIRFDTQSRRQSKLGISDGLPSDAVTSVAADTSYVWFATNKGLARYRKIDRSMRVYTDESGLPHRAVTFLASQGTTLWVGTRGGLAVYDPTSDGLRSYGMADGMASDFVEEVYLVRDEVWCRTDAGLSRLRPATRRFTNFGFDVLGGKELRVVLADGDTLWVGTENGLSSFESASEVFRWFPPQTALESKSIRGLEPFTDYLFITTDTEVVQYHKINHSYRRFTEADGLQRRTGARGTLLSSGLYTVLFPDEAWVLDVARDLWVQRRLAPTAAAGTEQKTSTQAWTTIDTQLPRDLVTGTDGPGAYANLKGGAGIGADLGDGRALEASAIIDYGQLDLQATRDFLAGGERRRDSLSTLGKIRDVSGTAEYRGREDDVLREVRASDKLSYKNLEEGLEASLLLTGAHARLASAGPQPAVQAIADGGMRRGVMVRDFLLGPRREVYQLSQKWVLPASERVYVDGELLVSGVDYTIIYPAGQLAFLDPERVDDLSVIEVQYEYDVIPKKGLGTVSLLDFLPVDNEVGGWVRSGEPRVVSEESGLYNQIDGGAPKYIDRGWVRSVFAEFRQGSRTVQVWVHDMGSEAGANDIFQYDLPPAREPVNDRDDVVLDVGLSTSYAVKAHSLGFYVELSIDEKSDVAKTSIKLFALQVLDRGVNAGKHVVDVARQSLVAARAAVSPIDGLELGGRVIEVQPFPGEPAGKQPRLRLMSGMVDSRYEQELSRGGRLTSYLEGGGSHDLDGRLRDGYGAMGQLRVSHPWVEGTAQARWYDQDYTPIGSNATLYGTLRDEYRLSTTLYPARWLPITAFADRQTSYAEDGGAPGLVQHATGRIGLSRPDLPAASVSVGQTLLEDGRSNDTSRLKAVGQVDYDLADGVLEPLGFKRFLVRALYGVSDAVTDSAGRFARNDRVVTQRYEVKLAPTATENAYALLRSREATSRDQTDGPFELQAKHWELIAGARSSIIPGLIPQVSQAVLFDDSPDATGVRVRRASASVAGQLWVNPGEWWSPLTPVFVDARYSYAKESGATAGIRVNDDRIQRFDNRMSYNGLGKWELALQQAWQVAHAGETQIRRGDRLELRNRVTFRPVHPSPITLRVDLVREKSRNDQAQLAGAPTWGWHDSVDTSLYWLMRWNTRFTTKLEADYTFDDLRDVMQPGTGATAATLVTGQQHLVRPWLELRYLLQSETGSLFLVQRDRATRTLTDSGTAESWGAEASLGIIWVYSDNVYLDGEVAYRQTFCVSAPCSATRVLEPRVLLTAKL